jgi:type IV secretion system protein VirB10
MTDPHQPAEGAEADTRPDGNKIEPLPGEPGIPNVAERHFSPMSKKGLLAGALFMLSVIAVAALSIQRFASSGHKADPDESRRVSDRPAAATTEPRRLEMPAWAASSSTAVATPRIPALVPTAEEAAEPIGVRRTGQGAPLGGGGGGSKTIPPEDAPVLLVTTRPGATGQAAAPATKSPVQPAGPAQGSQEMDANDPIAVATRNLEDYQRQLHGLLDTLTRSTAVATGQAVGGPPTAALVGGPPAGGHPSGGPTTGVSPLPGGDLFGGQSPGSGTPRVAASMLGNRSLVLPKGTAFTCALKTKVISATSGLVGCQVLRNVFSDDGRVLLIERGSHMDGEYRAASVRPGTVRIPVVWSRIRTSHGVTVDIDSPATGALGESGIDGYVDNRWFERIGAAMLVSLINDAVQLVIQTQTGDTQGDTIILPSTTSSTSKLAEKVLDSTINIPPLIYQNQGGIVGIYVARDVDFSSVYELQPTPTSTYREGQP